MSPQLLVYFHNNSNRDFRNLTVDSGSPFEDTSFKLIAIIQSMLQNLHG